MVETIGYEQVEGELTENTDEGALVEKINKAIDAVKEETHAEIDKLQATALETLNDVQLAAFLSKTFFPENKALSYSQCINNPNIRFSMRAALQLLKNRDDDMKKYNADGEVVEDDSGKTIDEWLRGDENKDGISNSLNNSKTIVKILQTKVGGAVVDGKPGPQTISRIIGELGGNIEPVYAAVNKYYGDKSEFIVKAVSKFPEKYSNDPNYEKIKSFLNKSYSFDSNKFDLQYEPENGSDPARLFICPVGLSTKVEVKINGGVPTADGYQFKENGWIVMNKPLNINGLGLIEVNSSDNIADFALPKDVSGKKLYYKDENIGNNKVQLCGYKEGNSFIMFPKLGNNIYRYPMPTKITYNGNLSPNFSYELNTDSNGLLNWLNYSLKMALKNAGIPTENRKIIYKNNKYYVSSFNHSAEITSNLLEKGFVFGGLDFPGELRVLNLANYYKNKFSSSDLQAYKNASGCGFRLTSTGGLYINNTPSSVSHYGVETDLLSKDEVKKHYNIDFNNSTQLANFAKLLNKEVLGKDI